MDMMERRIREVFANLLSRGAKALERTAGELEQAAAELRVELNDADRVWSEEVRREPERIVRGGPLRAVPDTPADEARTGDDTWTPPAEPPQMPARERLGDVDARVTTSTDVAGSAEHDVAAPAGPAERPTDELSAARVSAIADGTVAQARARLGGLTTDELRHLREIEVANRNRATLIAAIDRVLEAGG